MTGKDRERRLARERYERNLANREVRHQRARRRNAIVGAVLGVVLVVGGTSALAVTMDFPGGGEAEATGPGSQTSGGSKAGNKAGNNPGNTAEPASGSCDYTRVPEDQRTKNAKFVGLPPENAQPKAAYTAKIKTNHGAIVMDLLNDQAPCTVNSFRFLAQEDFFADTPCHRMLTGGSNILQCGDPSGTGKGGPGYSFPDENLDGAEYTKGTVAMANSGPDTNGSQFFMVFGKAQFPPNYTPFAKITSGIDVLREIAEQGTTGPNNWTPKAKVLIEDVKVTEEN